MMIGRNFLKYEDVNIMVYDLNAIVIIEYFKMQILCKVAVYYAQAVGDIVGKKFPPGSLEEVNLSQQV